MTQWWIGVVVLGFAFTSQAQAQVDLRTSPESPRASQPFSLHANGAGCHRFQNLDPSARVLSVQGSVIEVTVPYTYANPCVLPLVPVSWNLPGVSAGSYTIELYGEADDFPRALVEAIQVEVQPGVIASTPSVVPTNSWWALGLLSLGILMAFRARHRA